MNNIGIIGNGKDKFTLLGMIRAKILIRKILLEHKDVILISGHSYLEGIDIWSEEIANTYNIELDIKAPKTESWSGEYGYKERNIDIAESIDILHIVLADKYPPNYKGLKFNICYHDGRTDHVKSGACWTGKIAKQKGKEVIYHIINN